MIFRAGTILGVVHLCAATSVLAQPQLPITIGATAGLAFRNSSTVTGTDRTSGLVGGLNGSLNLGRASMAVEYRQGTLSSSATGGDQDLVEGEVTIGVRTATWLIVKAGLHLRSFVTGEVVVRWVLWEGRVRGEWDLYAPESNTFRTSSYVEGSVVVSGDASVVGQYDSGFGAEAGITLQLGRSPFHGRLSYRVDRGRLSGGTREETIEVLQLAVGVSLAR